MPGGERALKSVVIFGANGSGKSTVLRSIDWFTPAIRDSYRKWEPDADLPISPFRLADEYLQRRSEMEMEFITSGRRYIYGFHASRHAFEREYLFEIDSSGIRQLMFERDESREERVKFGPTVQEASLPTMVSLTRKNSLLLSTAVQTNQVTFSRIYDFLTNQIVVAWSAKNSVTDHLNKAFADENKALLLKLLRYADVGISDIEQRQIRVPEEWKSQLGRLQSAIASAFPDENPPIQFELKAPDKGITFSHDTQINRSIHII